MKIPQVKRDFQGVCVTATATTVTQYLAELPADRRAALEAVRQTILTSLPAGYEEAVNWGMIVYQVPLARCSDTYNGQPLACAALASQKNHMAVYLLGIYMDDQVRERFEAAYRATGKRYDVGKSCVRFKKLEDLPLALIGESIALFSVDEFVSRNHGLRAMKRRLSIGSSVPVPAASMAVRTDASSDG